MQATPILVLISGGPASGKSSLAVELSSKLLLPAVSRDLLKSGIGVTSGRVIDPEERPIVDPVGKALGGAFGQRAFDTLYRLLDLLLDDGVSLIIEQAWTRGLSERQLAPRIARSRAVLIHCVVDRDVAQVRYLERSDDTARAQSHPDDEIIRQMERGTFPWHEYDDPIDFGIPALVVDTTHGCDPPLDEIARFVWRETST